ncbi:MAG TPA: class I SAM-dependent methyltransferase [Dehalococcoidia bacterium]|nr:class I SAM-dependent methyltransferase [Dehalococcoidia bacterium]
MTQRKNEKVEAGEIAFFERVYSEGAYHPVGWRLRLSRELNSLRRAAGELRLERVLSLGCGDGQFELMLAPYAQQITALDISPQAIEIAKRNAARAKVTNVDYRCIALSELNWDAQFDAVICLAFLHHVPEPDLPDLLKQSFAHLKPGGLFYSQDPNQNGLLRKVGRVAMGKTYHKYHTPDERELVPGRFAADLRGAGFGSVHIGYIDVTLIPAYFVLTRGPGAPFYFCRALDWAWCHSPLARWASGFYAFGTKPMA